MRQVPIKSGWLGQPLIRFPAAALSSKDHLHVEIHLVFHYEIAGLADLAGQRLGRYHLESGVRSLICYFVGRKPHIERDVAMYLCREIGQKSLREIGDLFDVKYRR